ncbi:MAG: DNA-directed RNA polymerase subunit omega [Candidatus Aminicenantes bacterium]|nr:DNA-directed RNA polymerase subunit omega [Candidatus Aminicenantes bacterium]
MKAYGDVDSKFRFVILASKRAKQLLKGDKPKIKAKTKNLIRIAQEEVRQGLIDYEIIPTTNEEAQEPEEESFIGEEIGPDVTAPAEAEGKTEESPEKKKKKSDSKKSKKDSDE